MIEGFEDITRPLNDQEQQKSYMIAEHLKKHGVGRTNAVKAGFLAELVGSKESRVRAMIFFNYLRASGTCRGLVATSQGYYLADSVDDLQSYARSIEQRIGAIKTVLDATYRDIDSWRREYLEQGRLF